MVMKSVIETKASMILQFIDGLRGDLRVVFEEGTSSAWLYDLLKPRVTKLLVCDPRKNKSMREALCTPAVLFAHVREERTLRAHCKRSL
jgi:hypothetical protein